MSVVNVTPVGVTPYEVSIGRGAVDKLAGAVGSASRAAVLHTPSLTALAQKAAASVAGATLVEIPEGEAAKRIEVLDLLWQQFGAMGMTRDDVVIGVGGGAVTDVAGFAAATWLRGVKVIHVPTTVLAMVDAAIGGKTAINTAAGKNLVGAFHHPAAVLCDIDSLKTLPRAEVISGMAEVIKAGFIADPSILEIVERDPEAAMHVESDELVELIVKAVQFKADVVSEDPTEQGRREILNYGHTFGHAIEKVESFSWRHGEAVAVGMCFVAELARRSGRLDDVTADRHASTLEAIGLPTTYRGDRWAELDASMRIDKKNRGSHRRFIVLDGLAQPAALDDPSEELLQATYKAVSA